MYVKREACLVLRGKYGVKETSYLACVRNCNHQIGSALWLDPMCMPISKLFRVICEVAPDEVPDLISVAIANDDASALINTIKAAVDVPFLPHLYTLYVLQEEERRA